MFSVAEISEKANIVYVMSSVQHSQKKELTLLRQRLAQVASSWAIDDYKAALVFFTTVLPKLMAVERCTIFVLDLGSNRICSIFGTGLKERKIEPPLKGSLVGRVISSGQSMIDNELEKRTGFHNDAAEQTGFTARNTLCSPIVTSTGNKVSGAVQILNTTDRAFFTETDKKQLEEVARFLSISLESIMLNNEIIRIAGQLEKEMDRLVALPFKGTHIIAESPQMLEVLDLVKIVSYTPVNVMISGENGTGKELIAKLIHETGQRKDKPFVPVNCACIPEHLVESEFFGHEKGAFTGADTRRTGKFEDASGGTLFLDEVAEMPLVTQPKFLRAIQEKEGSRLGSNKMVSYDLRLICATNKDLLKEVEKGMFREDLFFRLFSVEIVIPPLRERKEDILPLSLYFLENTNKNFNKHVVGFSPAVLDVFEQYPWPGNVRQLMKEVERLVALTPDNETIQMDKCSNELQNFYAASYKENWSNASFSLPEHVEKLEKELIAKALRKTKGNKTQAAHLLNITRQGLGKKLKRYQLEEGVK